MITPGNWLTWSHFFPGPELDGKEGTHYLWQVSNNTQGLLAEANLITLRQRFAPWLGSEITESEIDAGLRGIIIHSFLMPMDHPACAVMEAAMQQLEDYAILDDETFSDLEEAARWENLTQELRFVTGSTPDEADVSAVAEQLSDDDYSDSSSGPWPCSDAVRNAAFALGLGVA